VRFRAVASATLIGVLVSTAFPGRPGEPARAMVASAFAVIRASGLDDRVGLAVAAAALPAVNVTGVVPVTPANVGVSRGGGGRCALGRVPALRGTRWNTGSCCGQRS
jgi:hypothetical protein